MSQNTSIYWKTPETAQRAKELADAGKQSVSAYVSALIEEMYKERFPVVERCPICGHQIVDDGQEADDKKNGGNNE